jgi:hypothetical protein
VKLTGIDIDDQKLTIKTPKSGTAGLFDHDLVVLPERSLYFLAFTGSS